MNKNLGKYIALSGAGTSYAILLNTPRGKHFADEYTWASVVLGNSIILAVLRFMIPEEHWRKILFAFILAGTPMIVRSLVNKFKSFHT